MTDFEVFYDSVCCEVVNQMFMVNPACLHVRTHGRTHMNYVLVWPLLMFFDVLIIHYTPFFCGAITPQRFLTSSSYRKILFFFEITQNDTPQLVGLLWTSDQLVAEIST